VLAVQHLWWQLDCNEEYNLNNNRYVTDACCEKAFNWSTSVEWAICGASLSFVTGRTTISSTIGICSLPCPGDRFLFTHGISNFTNRMSTEQAPNIVIQQVRQWHLHLVLISVSIHMIDLYEHPNMCHGRIILAYLLICRHRSHGFFDIQNRCNQTKSQCELISPAVYPSQCAIVDIVMRKLSIPEASVVSPSSSTRPAAGYKCDVAYRPPTLPLYRITANVSINDHSLVSKSWTIKESTATARSSASYLLSSVLRLNHNGLTSLLVE
jgi:hypothetical protein